MKKRSKNNSSIWAQRIQKMKDSHPDSINVENRQKAIAHIVVQSYPELKDIPADRGYELIKDICWIERLLRQENEKNQKKLKAKLEQKKLFELGYGQRKQ